MEAIHRVVAVAGALAALATGATLAPGHSMDVVAMVADRLRSLVVVGNTSGPTPAMYAAIKDAAAQETNGDVHVDRIDYVGLHTNGAGSVAYIFYVYFHDTSRLQFERFVRVLRTSDGSLDVLTA